MARGNGQGSRKTKRSSTTKRKEEYDGSRTYWLNVDDDKDNDDDVEYFINRRIERKNDGSNISINVLVEADELTEDCA